MKYKKVIPLVMLFFVLIGAVHAQNVSVEAIDSIAIDTFDGVTTEWTIRGSRDVDERFLDSRVVDAWPRTLHGVNPTEERRALGIRGGFTRRGYNFIEVVPPGGSVLLPGVVREIELWVWSARRNYYMTAELQDHRGVYHTISIGNINHLGWKKVSARVPVSVSQLRQQFGPGEQLELLKLLIWTRPEANVDQFQIYLDDLRVVTDTYRDFTDGDELANPETIEQIWGSQL